ncbi:MAG: hypothetical protein IPL40_02520 [Proteobacteria bacterium]|nr:hypothetical protein [Pseudomonadota bacterium]
MIKPTAPLDPRELAYCGLFGAAALLLPTLFHLLPLGRVFLPMYLPLMTLPFFVRPLPAATTAGLTPLISAAVTGMPPWYPPIALLMALELAAMALLLARLAGRWPRAHAALLLLPVLVLGRALAFALAVGCARIIALPAGFLTGLSWLSGWPGVILMALVVPGVARIARSAARPTTACARSRT